MSLNRSDREASLHDVIYKPEQYTEEDIKDIIEKYPNSLFEEAQQCRTPLHTLAINCK